MEEHELYLVLHAHRGRAQGVAEALAVRLEQLEVAEQLEFREDQQDGADLALGHGEEGEDLLPVPVEGLVRALGATVSTTAVRCGLSVT